MNQFDEFTWEKVLSLYPDRNYSVSEYQKILSPEFPGFLKKYLSLPIMTRLKGIGLLCGTDWTPLYKNRFYYSRFDHSVGVSLIVWNFTHDKKQALAGLLHDVSTPVFSHVADFRKGDALTQSATEEPNELLIKNNAELKKLLAEDGLTADDVCDYHKYPIADNEIPCLSADRLEYMYPSGMALEGSWTLEEIERTYNDITILKNENGIDELGFQTLELAELYCYRFCMTGHLLQLNENKLTLQLLAKITSLAVECGIILEEEFMTLSEKEVISRLEKFTESVTDKTDVTESETPGRKLLCEYFKTFRTMTKIEHTENEPSPEEYFSVSLKVKQRYINPLVKTGDGVKRLYDVSEKSRKLIDDFLSYTDIKFGAVKLV